MLLFEKNLFSPRGTNIKTHTSSIIATIDTTGTHHKDSGVTKVWRYGRHREFGGWKARGRGVATGVDIGIYTPKIS